MAMRDADANPKVDPTEAPPSGVAYGQPAGTRRRWHPWVTLIWIALLITGVLVVAYHLGIGKGLNLWIQ